MTYAWKQHSIPRFYGLDKKTNLVDIKDSESPDASNVFQNKWGVISKRRGNDVMFDRDSSSNSLRIDEIGSCTLNGTKYWFKFSDGKFFYCTTTVNSTPTQLTPSPAIASGGEIWFAVLDNKLFFVDGSNVLRFFDGTNIKDSTVYVRPTEVLSATVVGTGYDYTYTVERAFDTSGNGSGESPSGPTLVNKIINASIVVTRNTGPQTLVVGDKIRVYARSTTTVAWKNVTPTTGNDGATNTYSSDAYGGYLKIVDASLVNYTIATLVISDDLPNLYSDLGLALNKSAPIGLTGITVYYNRLIGWKGSYVYNAKSTNPHSWPDNSTAHESFIYGYALGDGENIAICIPFKESLFVMKTTKISVFGGFGPDDTGGNAYSYRRLETNGIGVISPKSVQVIGEEEGHMLIFLSRDGFYATTGSIPMRVGEKIEVDVQTLDDATLRKSHSFYHKRDGFYYCFIGNDVAKKCHILDTHKDQGSTVGWFQLNSINAVCVYWDDDKYIFGDSLGVCRKERNSLISTDFSDSTVEYIAAGAINTTTDRITVVNNYATGSTVRLRSAGTFPTGISENMTYYVININSTTIKLATSYANAILGVSIDITNAGTGNHTIVSPTAISAYYTTNWIKFNNAALVKKLGKPLIILNAAAISINLKMSCAYDWVPNFADPHTISIASGHLWGAGTWGSFLWGAGIVAEPKNVAIDRRKCRSVRYKFENSNLNQDFDLQGIVQQFAYLRNRGNFA